MENTYTTDEQELVFYGEPIEILACKVPRVQPSTVEGPAKLLEDKGNENEQ